MYEIDISRIDSTLKSLFLIIGGLLHFDAGAIEAISYQEGGNLIAILILVFGGTSLAIGQSVVLFANRVSKRRFFLSLIASGVIFLLWVLLWASSVWLLFTIVHGQQFQYADVLRWAAASMVPLMYGFLVLLPYIGDPIFQFLRIWVLFSFLVNISIMTDSSYLGALAYVGLGWLLIEVVFRFPQVQFERIKAWWWTKITGTPSRLDVDEVVQQFIDDLHNLSVRDADNNNSGRVQ